ncbi:phage tail protein [Acinetobacter sp. YK3]|uniref:phage tail fiber protein n=1 Tax=Acinetobacter sp. YK3 TaxID=1860097 RepID=UPI00084CBE60|nr:phage tail protein [Acinetobacter sp. YK3]OEC84796.1 phage tail protein [Acinetobacter sp. YK3]
MANLVFKFNWEHRPYPYNAAQGKQQFMLPFASGIPNLTPDWTQVQGAGNAATRSVGLEVGNVVEVGALGLFITTPTLPGGSNTLDVTEGEAKSGATYSKGGLATVAYGAAMSVRQGNRLSRLYFGFNQSKLFHVITNDVTATPQVHSVSELRTTANTTTDVNGFIKETSPIVKLFANAIELNDEAKEQPITFERLGTGDYLLKGSLGFAQEGWYIEIPKDANGNTVVAVLYETLENGDISIKTYKRKFDFEIAAVVADLDNPLDIPAGRWIDIRLHEEPISEEQLLNEMDDAISETPVEFQPTNLAQAVAAAMDGIDPPEINEQQS